jgi:O-methyltransferase
MPTKKPAITMEVDGVQMEFVQWAPWFLVEKSVDEYYKQAIIKAFPEGVKLMSFPKQVTENTLVDYPRLNKIRELVKQTEHLPGDIAEVGVYKGGTAYLICSLTKKDVVLFDTFEGMPAVDESKDRHKEGDFSDTSRDDVDELLDRFDNAFIFEGIFPKETAYYLDQDEVYSFVHLDCDIYTSVKESLEFFYPRMVPGGVIVFDDYGEPNCPGAKLAVDEFMVDKPEWLVVGPQSQAHIVKR